MKTTVIADVHGRSLWKLITHMEQDSDRFVFLGDYFDSFDIDGLSQIQNFKDIVRFKVEQEAIGKEVVMLIGNHDEHYFPYSDDSSTSGYQFAMASSIKFIVGDNKQHLQIAYKMDEFVLSHAGISSEWMDDRFLSDWNVDNMVEKVNELFLYKPNEFNFRSFKGLTFSNGYGDNTYQGPLWIRPKSLKLANYDTLRKEIIQVVGHTVTDRIDTKGGATGGRYYFVDVQETSEEYMIITDGKISFNTTKQKK